MSTLYPKLQRLTLGITLVFIAGCAGRTTVPEDHFYQLPEIGPVMIYDSGQIDITIGVDSLRSDGLHGERAILFINTDTPLELHRYHYHHWTDSPPRLIQESLLKYLRKSRLAQNVVRYEPGQHMDGTIEGTLLHFERIIGPNGINVEVALDLGYLDQKHHLAWHKEYHATAYIKDSALHSSIEGFGTALQQIFDTFAKDLMSKLT